MNHNEDEFEEFEPLDDYDKYKDPNYLQVVQSFKEGLPIRIYASDVCNIGATIIINGVVIDLLDYGFTLLIFANIGNGDSFPSKESFNYMDVLKTIYPINDTQFDKKLTDNSTKLELKNEYLDKFSFIVSFNEIVEKNKSIAKVSERVIKRLKS